MILLIILFSIMSIRGKLEYGFNQQQTSKCAKLSALIVMIAQKCQEYVGLNKEMTNDINEIIGLPIRDLWGNEFYITDYKYVTSAGPDKTKNTKDDIYILYFKTKSEIQEEIWNIMKKEEMKNKF